MNGQEGYELRVGQGGIVTKFFVFLCAYYVQNMSFCYNQAILYACVCSNVDPNANIKKRNCILT